MKWARPDGGLVQKTSCVAGRDVANGQKEAWHRLVGTRRDLNLKIIQRNWHNFGRRRSLLSVGAGIETGSSVSCNALERP